VLLVVQAGVTTKPAIQEAVATIGDGKLLGVVLNGSANSRLPALDRSRQ
jgi:hypothetical protein